MTDQTVLLLWQFISAVVIPHAIQWLKGQTWFPFANFTSSSLNRVFSWMVATLTGLGLGFTFDHTSGTFTITGLTLSGIIAGLTHVGTQLALNHTAYKLLVAPPQSGVQQAINRDAGTPNAVGIPAEQPKPQPSYVGQQWASTGIFESLPGDPTPDGATDPSGKYVKHADGAVKFYTLK
jgi:hypothetical protein